MNVHPFVARTDLIKNLDPSSRIFCKLDALLGHLDKIQMNKTVTSNLKKLAHLSVRLLGMEKIAKMRKLDVLSFTPSFVQIPLME